MPAQLYLASSKACASYLSATTCRTTCPEEWGNDAFYYSGTSFSGPRKWVGTSRRTADSMSHKSQNKFLSLTDSARGHSEAWEGSPIRSGDTRTPHFLMQKDPKLQDGIKPCSGLTPSCHHSAYTWFLLVS